MSERRCKRNLRRTKASPKTGRAWRQRSWNSAGNWRYLLKQEYEDSAQTQADAMARFNEAVEQAREDGYADDGGLLGGTRRIIRSLKDALD